MDETRALAEEAELAVKAARELGQEYGTSAGSWVIDGNTDELSVRTVLHMIEDGDPEFEIPAPLSGEWADGYSLGRLSDDLGVDQESDEFDDLCSIFEAAYYEAYEAEVVRSARAILS